MATTRERASENTSNDELPRKRPRRLDEESVTETASLESINGDCLLYVLSYLHFDDLNSLAICSRRYRTARAHESLDQTRTGTIIIVSAGSTATSFFNAIAQNGWNEIFQGNRTHLKIVGPERLQRERWIPSDVKLASAMTGVKSATMTRSLILDDGLPTHATYPSGGYWILTWILYSLRELDMSFMQCSHDDAVRLLLCCNGLERLRWNGFQEWFNLNGCNFLPAAFSLTDISLDDCHFEYCNDMSHYRYSQNSSNAYMLSCCSSLERLSIKNATSRAYKSVHPFQPVSQEILIKMVRRHPTLRWLRSDLTDENVAILKQERPEMVFAR